MDAIISVTLLNLNSQNHSINQAARDLRRSPIKSTASKVDHVAQSLLIKIFMIIKNGIIES